MNLLLLRADEVSADGRIRLTGRRANHLRTVLGAEPGREVRVGLLDGPLGTAAVQTDYGDAIELQCTLGKATPPAPADALLLAVPRPKVLLRILAHAAAMGFGRIVLFRSWRVEKSHLRSRALDPDLQRLQLIAGLEQGVRTHLPRVEFHPLFRPFVEDRLDHIGLPRRRYLGHPGAEPLGVDRAGDPAAPFALALGPEGGLIPWEMEQLQARGFETVGLGAHPLRTETALAALWGQLELVRSLACRSET